MQILVQGQRSHLFNVEATTTVDDVMAFVEAAEGIPASEQYLTCIGAPLAAGETLINCVHPMASVVVGVRMLGGKVHGSLARAGKVKGQTPKVDKQEKKKLKTGRAKRRQQYNKRFVNVVAGPGKKRGPNAQS